MIFHDKHKVCMNTSLKELGVPILRTIADDTYESDRECIVYMLSVISLLVDLWNGMAVALIDYKRHAVLLHYRHCVLLPFFSKLGMKCIQGRKHGFKEMYRRFRKQILDTKGGYLIEYVRP